MTNLGTLGGASEATGINDAAEVVGKSVLASGTQHAFLYSGGVMLDLDTLGGTNSEATAINNWSQVVGLSDVAAGGTHAFLYQSATMRDLNTLLPSGSGWVLEAATAINDAGEIVGYGRHNGVRHAFRLTPPATIELRSGGGLSQLDSNIPRNGVQVGRDLRFVTSITSLDGTARNIVFTGTVSGPVEIVGVRTYEETLDTLTEDNIGMGHESIEPDGSANLRQFDRTHAIDRHRRCNRERPGHQRVRGAGGRAQRGACEHEHGGRCADSDIRRVAVGRDERHVQRPHKTRAGANGGHDQSDGTRSHEEGGARREPVSDRLT